MNAPTLRRNVTESAFPVYWLHQSAIVLIGALIIPLQLGIAAKYALLLAASTSATLAVYHVAIRPFRIARFCVGMKPRHPRPAAARLARHATAVLALGLATACVPRAAAGSNPIGRWYAEGGAAQVEITQCGDALCGRVVWLRAPFDEHGCTLRDRFNSDEALRQRAVLGIEILHGLRSERDDRVWEHGAIYDPTSGRTYTCRMTLLDDNRVELRGYLGIPLLGRTTTWIRVGAEERVCRTASVP
jgi:uncharacterized protein (DUF2147 family)